MIHMIDSQIAQDIIIAIVFVGGVVLYRRKHVPEETIASLSSLVQAQKERLDLLTQEQLEQTKIIADLQGQIKVYKSLPLRELADGMKENNSLSTKILETLKTSAITLVQDTKETASHVSEVRQDLRSA